jgi:hypothetical protein
MSGKNQYVTTYNWQLTNPIPTFLPNPHAGGSLPSGVILGPMAGVTTIYSNIIDLAKMDAIGLEVTWTGTPTGTLSVLASNSGAFFYPLTFDPALGQPAGTPGGYVVDLIQYPFRYILLEYTNLSGAGTLYVVQESKDFN